MREELIGYWKEESQKRIYHGEYAGHEEDWKTDTCEAPVVAIREHDRAYWYIVRIPATRTRYYFWSRIGAHGSAHIDKKPRRGTYNIQLDAYDLAQYVDNGIVRLVNSWKVETVGVYDNGEPMRKVSKERNENDR